MEEQATQEAVAVRTPTLGQAVVYVDPVGVRFDALVTAVWGPTCLNLVVVSGDAARTDSYGRQIERAPTSLMHQSVVPVHGNYWRFQDEEPKPTEREQ